MDAVRQPKGDPLGLNFSTLAVNHANEVAVAHPLASSSQAKLPSRWSFVFAVWIASAWSLAQPACFGQEGDDPPLPFTAEVPPRFSADVLAGPDSLTADLIQRLAEVEKQLKQRDHADKKSAAAAAKKFVV